jgi:Tol biopolymer transport system component
MRVAVCLIILMVILLTLVISPSYGQTSVTNGRIAFSSDMDGDFEIYTINPDGTDLQQLTFNELDDGAPEWSPDGQRIAFHSANEENRVHIFVMNADGSEQVDLLQDGYHPIWSPDETQIAFASNGYSTGVPDVFVMEVDGSNVENLTRETMGLSYPAFWSWDGNTLYFLSTADRPIDRDLNLLTLYSMNADGSHITELFDVGGSVSSIDLSLDGNRLVFGIDHFNQVVIAAQLDGSNEIFLTNGETFEDRAGYPSWSPDGTMIVYIYAARLAVMNSDGSNSYILLDEGSVRYRDPDWQPLFVDTMTPEATITSTP